MVHSYFSSAACTSTRCKRFSKVGRRTVSIPVPCLTFSRIFTFASVLLGVTTILIFLYLVLLPRIRGVNPNVCFVHLVRFFILLRLTCATSIQIGENLLNWQLSYQSVPPFFNIKTVYPERRFRSLQRQLL